MKVTENFDIREFVPKIIWDAWGERSTLFVAPVCWKFAQFTKDFFTDYFTQDNPKIERVSVIINDWSWGGKFQWRGLRTYEYLKEKEKKGEKCAKLTQHLGGSCNAIDFNVLVKFKDGTKKYIDCNIIRTIILDNEKKFMEVGLTRLESGKIATSWVHADFAFTGLNHIHIIQKG